MVRTRIKAVLCALVFVACSSSSGSGSGDDADAVDTSTADSQVRTDPVASDAAADQRPDQSDETVSDVAGDSANDLAEDPDGVTTDEQAPDGDLEDAAEDAADEGDSADTGDDLSEDAGDDPDLADAEDESEVADDAGSDTDLSDATEVTDTGDTTDVTDIEDLADLTEVDSGTPECSYRDGGLRLVSDHEGCVVEPYDCQLYYRSSIPDLAVLPNGDVVVAWEQEDSKANSSPGLWLRSYRDGIRPREALLITEDELVTGNTSNVLVAAGHDNAVHIAFVDDGRLDGDRDPDQDIIYRRLSPDRTMGDIVVISTDPTEPCDHILGCRSKYPAMAASRDLVHFVWEDIGHFDDDGEVDDVILYATYDGETVSAAQVLTGTTGSDWTEGHRPQIALDSNDCPHVVWHYIHKDEFGDIDRRGIQYASPSGTETCGDFIVEELADEVITGDEFPVRAQIAIDEDDRVGVTFYFRRDGVFHHYLTTGASGGSLRGNHVRILNHSGAQFVLDVSLYGSGSTFLIPFSASGEAAGPAESERDVFVARFGTELGATVPLSGTEEGSINTGRSGAPQVAVSSTAAYFVWQDESDYDGDGVSEKVCLGDFPTTIDEDIMLLRRPFTD